MNTFSPSSTLPDHDDLMSFLTEYLILPHDEDTSDGASGADEASLGDIREVLAATQGDLSVLTHRQLVRLQDAFWQAFQAVAEVQVTRLNEDIEANRSRMVENLASVMDMTYLQKV